MFASLGANVVVNDVSEKAANGVVDEIKKSGNGNAIAVIGSAEKADELVKGALDAFGRIDALVANAGILRDKSFAGMTEAEWDAVMAVHLKGTYKVGERHVRSLLLNNSSVSRLYSLSSRSRATVVSSLLPRASLFMETLDRLCVVPPKLMFALTTAQNYSSAKAAIIGLTRTVAIEGEKYG